MPYLDARIVLCIIIKIHLLISTLFSFLQYSTTVQCCHFTFSYGNARHRFIFCYSQTFRLFFTYFQAYIRKQTVALPVIMHSSFYLFPVLRKTMNCKFCRASLFFVESVPGASAKRKRARTMRTTEDCGSSDSEVCSMAERLSNRRRV